MSRRVARSGVHSAIRLDPDASTTMQRFLQLPSHVFQLVLAFADGDYVTEPFPARPRLPAELFARLVRADARLAPALGELRREFDAAVVHFAFQDVDMKRTNQHDARLVARLVGCSDRVRSLQLGLAMAELRSQFEVAKARVFAHAFDNMPIDWDRVLALCPQLVRLDLSEMPLRSTHLPAILRAASRHCRQIKSLVLPEKEWYRRPVGSDFEVVSKALYASLEEWFHANGGLRQLTVPQRTACPEMSATHQSLADEFLLTVAAFCPELEHFDGWKASLREADGTLHCDERIDCSLAAWQVFCRSCPKLREVHWCVFPFVDEYFLTFAATPRPDVRKLALSTKACISRDESPGVEIHQTGCEISSVSKAVAACSGLEELSIILQEEFSDSRTPQLDTVVGDGLLEVVAKHCPRLTRLNILQAESGGGSIPSTDNTGKSITDRGLAALSVLPELRAVQINIGSNCGADGLFALLATSPFVGPAREIDLVIGSYDSDMLSLRSGPQQTTPRATSSKSSVFFHVVLLELLELLVVHHRTLQGRRFRLRLRNGSSLFTDDSGKWQEKLEAIAAQLSVHCPQLNLHIARQGGVSGAMLSQSAHRRGSLSGVTWKRRSSSCLDDATDWGMMAWCAVALTAAVTYTRAS